MSEHNLRAIKTQLSGSANGFAAEDGPGTRSGRRSARGRSQPFFIGVAGQSLVLSTVVTKLSLKPIGGCDITILYDVSGGTASGKTTVCDQIMQWLHDQCVVMLSQDSFYRGLTPEECKNVKGTCAGHIVSSGWWLCQCLPMLSLFHTVGNVYAAYSFDEPDAFDTPALVNCLQALRVGNSHSRALSTFQ